MVDSTPYEIVCSSDDEEQWLAERRKGIGASEMPCVLGCGFASAYALWLAKRGEIPDPFDDNESMFWGRVLEPAIIEGYRQRTGRWAMRAGRLLRSKAHPWALATLDAWTSIGTPGRPAEHHPLEVKNWSIFAADQWEHGAPEGYLIQAHQQMLVTGTRRATVAVLLGGQKLAWQDVERDEQTIRKIIYHGERFWQMVQSGEEPPVDDSDSTRLALQQRYPQHAEELVALDAEHTRYALEARRLCDEATAAKRAAEGFKNELRRYMGTADRAEGDGVAVTWATNARGHRTMRITERT